MKDYEIQKIPLKERICKYCLISFADEIELFQSMRHGYFICQECFHDRRNKKLTI